MNDFFLILFLISIGLLAIGRYFPSLFSLIFRGKQYNKKQRNVLIFLSIVFFILFGIFSDSEEAKKIQENTTIKNEAVIKDVGEIQHENASNAEQTAEKQTVEPEEENKQSDENLFRVSRVIDGDTIELEGGQKVRYIGINSPETVHPEKSVECFGKEASNKNKELVEGKEIKLEKDVSETDKYDRLLRYVYVGDLFINDYLVRNGYAYSSSYPPDIKFQEQFRKAEEEAKNNKRGLWADNVCNSTNTPTNQNTGKDDTKNTSCNIKGNISSSGEKIYHVPGGQYYEKTVINTSAGERWFCNEAEAVNAGWRKSKR